MIGFKLTLNGIPAGVPRSLLNKMMKDAYGDTGKLWHAKHRPKHFTTGAAGRYHYDRRSFRYTERKFRKWGHKDPLVWSGQSRLLTQIRDVRTSSKGARVVMGARTLNFRPKGHSKTMAEELRAVTRGEVKELVGRFTTTMTRRLRGLKKSRTRRF